MKRQKEDAGIGCQIEEWRVFNSGGLEVVDWKQAEKNQAANTGIEDTSRRRGNRFEVHEQSPDADRRHH